MSRDPYDTRGRPASDGVEALDDAPAAAWDFGPMPYQVTCFAALAAIYLLQIQRGVHLADLLIPLVGVLGVLSRWSLAPLMLLLVLAGTHALKVIPGLGVAAAPVGRGALEALDIFLAIAVLAYVGAQYRLQGLTAHILPPDPRRRVPEREDSPRTKPAPQPRSHPLASRTEVGLFLLLLPVYAIAAELAWVALDQRWQLAGWPERLNRLIVVAWVLGAGLFVTGTLFAHWKHRQYTAREAALFMQDALWQETRGDQRRITRWLAWARLKRRGENP